MERWREGKVYTGDREAMAKVAKARGASQWRRLLGWISAWAEALTYAVDIGNTHRDDGIGFQRFQILGPLGHLRGQVALHVGSNRTSGSGDAGALRLCLVIAGPSGKVHLDGGRSDEGHACFGRNGPVAFAPRQVAP